MRACPSCGASNGSADDFCGNCGAYLGWSDSASAPSTPPEPPAAPDPAPVDPAPAPAPEDGPAPAAPPRASSPRTRLTGRNRGGAGEGGAAGARRSGGEGPGRTEPAGPPSQAGPAGVRTGPPAPAPRPATGDGGAPHPGGAPPTTDPAPSGSAPSGSGAEARPPEAPPAPAPATPPAPAPRNTPGPRPPAAPAPDTAAQDSVLPVRPAKPVAPRPAVVRPAAVPEEVAGAPCPACGTANPPGRRFCRRCATALDPAAEPAPLPWWRTVWPLRRRVRASSGRAVRSLVILAVVAALCAGGFLLLPAGRALFEDTRDKLGKPKPVTPVSTEASAEVPRHPAGNTTDGVSNSYWGAPGPGASVTYTFREPFRLVDLIVTNGASTDPEDYARQARALQLDLEVTTRDGEKHHRRLVLGDRPGPQPVSTGISDVTTVRLVLNSAAGLAPGRHLALAEVEFFQRG